MADRIAPQEVPGPAERHRSRMAAEHLALDSLHAYDAPPLPPARPARDPVERDEGRLLRLGLLPLAAWCGSVLLDLSAIGIVGSVLGAVLVAGVIARFR